MARHRLPERSVCAAATLIAGLACAIVVALASLAPPVASAETQGQAIVADANQYLGDAYCWDGGTLTPSPGPTHGDGNGEEWYGGSAASGCNNSGPEASVQGFDCSGLAMVAVYEATGIALPHSSQAQSTYGGTTISGGLGNAEPGDLLFFGSSPSGIEHVGIYTGGGDMINAYDYKNDGDNGSNNEYWGVTEMPVSWVTYALPLQKIVRYWSGNGGSGPPMSNGSFVRTPDGSIYVVAGGAALHVDNCAPLGGCPGVVELANLAGYATEPSNGTFLRVADGSSAGLIARVVGGVPLGLDTCEGIPECSSAVSIDSGGYSDYSAAHQTIANGTVVRVADGPENGLIGRVVGGVLLGFLTCEGIPECNSAVNVDEDAYNWYADQYHTIANGTVVRVADGPENGLIGRVVGGVLLGFTTCEGIPECGSAVNVAENAYNYYAGEFNTIANGTVVRVADGHENGLIGRVVGGVLLGFTTCEGIPECGSAVNVAENAYNYYADEYHTIANGTFVRVADGGLTGLVARAAGGALIGLATCVPLEECPGYVNIAENAFASYTAEHPEPANGTLVEGLPSGTYWSFNNGQREPASPNANAIAIDDGGLASYPIKTQSIGTAPTTVTSATNTNGSPPANQPNTSTPSHGVLGTKTTKPSKSASSLSRAVAKCRKIKNRHKHTQCIATAKKRYGRQHSRLPSRSKARR